MAAIKPRILILGGLGFVGKHLVSYLVKNEVASKIRVVDKVPQSMARLSKADEATFEGVECLQANLSRAESMTKAFADAAGDYDIVFNLAAEGRQSQSDEVYAENITKIAVLAAEEATKHKTQKFVQVSSAEIYEPKDTPAQENAPVKPWSGIGRAKSETEKQLKAIKGLNLVIVRLAIVYGPGDIRGLAPRLCIAAVYKKMAQTLEFPSWFEKTKINTVHVDDVVKGLWHVAQNAPVGSAYNLADKNDTDQKKLNVIFEKIFGIKTDVLGALKSEAAKHLDRSNLTAEINGEHAPTWSRMTKEAGLDYSPLSPWLDEDAVSNNHISVDGSAIEATGFAYDHPKLTEDLVKQQVEDAISVGWFPKL